MTNIITNDKCTCKYVHNRVDNMLPGTWCVAAISACLDSMLPGVQVTAGLLHSSCLSVSDGH